MTFIAQFVDTEVFGGAEAIALSLAKALNARGLRSTVFHFGNPEMESYARKLGVEDIVLGTDLGYKRWQTLPKFAWHFSSKLRTLGVDILHSHLFGPVIAGSLASRLARIPHVGTLHDSYSLEESSRRVRALQLASLTGTRLVAVSRTLESYCRSRRAFSSDGLRTIHNGVPELSDEVAARASLRQALGFAPDDYLFISVGRLVPLKRHSLLVEALSLLPSSSPAKLLIVGEGHERAALEARIKELKLETRVKLLGFRSDVFELLEVSDCFALASSTECLSCSILEAMRSGLPVLATRVGGNVELISEGENGVFIEREAKDIAEKMKSLIENPDMSASYGRASRKRYLDYFSHAGMVEAYLKLYSEITSSELLRESS